MGWGEAQGTTGDLSTGTTRQIEIAHAALDRAHVPPGSLAHRATIAACRLVETDDTPRGEVYLAITAARLHADLKRRAVGTHYYRAWIDNPEDGLTWLITAVGAVALSVTRHDVAAQQERLLAVAEIAAAWLEAWARQAADVRLQARQVGL